ncbi:MAG TPA: hypothetical protein G4O02_13400 [Caldilineae bacterium]|nr:hypothetical protein [Caldilineae bacterium]
MVIGPAPLCMFCKHYRGNWICKAFPKGIPEEIVLSATDHREPFAGDRGIRFEPVDERAEDYAQELFGGSEGTR